ncbi:hypothetical protein PINS_up020178 [Pythium insidiosum]|nr:hypothetical protein PINS_up020178 [Pythium insidiosum]
MAPDRQRTKMDPINSRPPHYKPLEVHSPDSESTTVHCWAWAVALDGLHVAVGRRRMLDALHTLTTTTHQPALRPFFSLLFSRLRVACSVSETRFFLWLIDHNQ